MFPDSLGGLLITNDVCKACNDKLGEKVDVHLVNHGLMQFARFTKGLKGKKGKLPNPIGIGKYKDEPETTLHYKFTNDGKPLNPSSVYTWWGRFIKKNNLPYIRFHDLRHTSATLLINEGAHMKTISNRLGHASISTTMNIYGHALKEVDQKAADMFNHLFDEEEKNA
ncbi:tyrosine-type recombinase/integrase [Bacillus thuringiensis]|uniref:tyrosine-type recombinase/integrase n=1 Tax=Bacillus thuringiensis TaxID=1428 RepID=UPI0020D25656|nr:tyrosine-type recombinase/integrase [Bacillus thuringiensis]